MINLQPSQADRWMTCPASAMLLKGSSEYVASGQPIAQDVPEYTSEGTMAHQIAKDKIYALCHGTKLPVAPTNDMDIATTQYAQGVCDVFAQECYPLRVITVENTQTIYKENDIQCVGTPDATIITPQTIHVFEFKYGCGDEIQPAENKQLYLYAVGQFGLYQVHNIPDKVTTIILHIFQPRQGVLWREHKLTRQELLDWYCTEFVPVILQLKFGQPQFKTGKGCKYCPIKYRCKTWLHEITESLMNLSDESPLLTNEDLSQIAEHLDNLSRFSQDAKKQIVEAIESGQNIPDVEIEYSKGSPKITDEKELVRRLREIGLTDDQIFKKQMVQTFGELRKIIGHEKLKSITDGVVQYSERKVIKKK